MKNKYIFAFFMFYLSVLVSAQENNNSIYLFQNFENGKAILKNNTVSSGLFNYNLLVGTIEFKEGDHVLKLSEPSSVQTIVIGKHLFEHVGSNVFYEKLSENGLDYYVYWKSTCVSEAKDTGYGVSHTSSTTEINQTEIDGRISNFEGGNSRLLSKNTYFLKVGNKFKRFNSVSSLAKLFKGHEQEINDGLNSKNLNFKKIDDVKIAIAFCSKFLD